MTIEQIQEICHKLPHTTTDIKWENHLCFNIGGKMYLILGMDEIPVNASFKVSEENFIELQEREGCKPAPYLARYKWIAVDDINRFSKKEWETLLRESYELILSKLPKKVTSKF